MEPKTLDELLDVLPTMRKLRSLNADLLRVMLGRRRDECTWCGDRLPQRRHKWCSDECVKRFKERCDPQYGAGVVIERAKGICESCGRDTVAAKRDGLAAWRKHCDANPTNWRPAEVQKIIFEQYGFGRGHWSEVDHVLPVCEGGGLCGPQGLRFLCGQCHLKATNELHSRLSGARVKRSGLPAWVWCDCKQHGCEGFFANTKSINRHAVRLTCHICKCSTIVDRSAIDGMRDRKRGA